MTLLELVPYLLDPEKFKTWLFRQGIPAAPEELTICVEEQAPLSVETPIKLFREEEAGEYLDFQRDGIAYTQLLPVFIAIDFLEGMPAATTTNLDRAEALLHYGIYDA